MMRRSLQLVAPGELRRTQAEATRSHASVRPRILQAAGKPRQSFFEHR